MKAKSLRTACIWGLVLSIGTVAQADRGKAPVPAPFSDKLDTICSDEWWERHDGKQRILSVDVPREDVICFGIYTVHNGILKMTAQLFPLYPEETRTVRLEIMEKGKWKQIATAPVNDIGWAALFRVENWDQSKNIPYRLRHGETASFEGLIRKDPVDKNEIVVASLNCNSKRDRGNRNNYVRNINHLDPDLMFFAGDQSYDHREHTAAWLLFGLQFRDTFRQRPCITIPDDHDVGHANLWGEGGKQSKTPAGHDGGYFYDVDYVKMVERCQTAHLPDPYDPTPIKRGIGVYYTSLNVGGVDFAVIEDRKFKSGPAGKIPLMGPRPDHIRSPDYDPKDVDLPGLTLLGDRQLAFLRDWGKQWKGVSMKAVLSQTDFAGAVHRHGSFKNVVMADLDCNGWPQTGRNKAVRAITDAGAVHLCGDQHLAVLIQHGVDAFHDGHFSFVAPAIVNTIYKRWWYPPQEKVGADPDPNNLLKCVGDYHDGLGNKLTMYAYANPETDNRHEGFGLVRFNKAGRTITFECWDRNVDVTQTNAKQMTGWPRTIRQEGKKGNAPLWEMVPLE